MVDISSLAQLAASAQHLAPSLRAGMVIGLQGSLGVGKTALVTQLVKALGCDTLVTSPTFGYVHSYQCVSFTVHHFDWYRLEDVAALEGIGWRDYLDGSAVVLVEWPDRLPQLAAIFSQLWRLSLAEDGSRSLWVQGPTDR
jgi:tRNA threonylcarbamoyladenosine biosynthesis protein TsaE